MRVACAQFQPAFGDVRANLAAIRRLVPPGRADLVVLPELCTTGYTFVDRDELAGLAEEIPGGPTTRELIGLAADTGSVIVAGLAERNGARLHNSSVLVDPGGFVGLYRKVHLFDRENDLFDPGDLGFPVFDAGGARVGMMVCFDWFYPESMRALTLAGAQIVAHPSNLVLSWCQRSMPVRCLENHVIALTANRTGEEIRGGMRHRFTGASQITGFAGEVLAAARPEGEAWIEAVVEPQRAVERTLGTMVDFLALRKPDAYSTLA